MSIPTTVNSSKLLVLQNHASYPLRGSAGAIPTVVQQLPGGSLIARGVGETDVKNVSAASGSLQIDFITPGSGLESLAFMVDNAVTPNGFLGVGLDTHARPYATIKNAAGTIVAQSTSSAAFGTPGVPVQVILSWSALSGLAFLTVNGVVAPSTDWTTMPSGPWIPFVPAALQVGVGNVLGFSDFNPSSSLLCVQLSPTSPTAPVFPTYP